MTPHEQSLAPLALQFPIPAEAAFRLDLSEREIITLLLAGLSAIRLGQSEANPITPLAPTSATVANATTQIVAANSARRWLCLVNTGADKIFLGLGIAAGQNQGITLMPAGGTFVMDGSNLYRGAINGISAAGDCIVTVQEG